MPAKTEYETKEAVRVAREVLASHDPFGTVRLNHEFIEKVAAEAYAKGAQRDRTR